MKSQILACLAVSATIALSSCEKGIEKEILESTNQINAPMPEAKASDLQGDFEKYRIRYSKSEDSEVTPDNGGTAAKTTTTTRFCFKVCYRDSYGWVNYEVCSPEVCIYITVESSNSIINESGGEGNLEITYDSRNLAIWKEATMKYGPVNLKHKITLEQDVLVESDYMGTGKDLYIKSGVFEDKNYDYKVVVPVYLK
jgi:hypothetical protein